VAELNAKAGGGACGWRFEKALGERWKEAHGAVYHKHRALFPGAANVGRAMCFCIMAKRAGGVGRGRN